MPDIAVVVVAYRSSATIEGCLSPILADQATRVAVVDNSDDPATRACCARLADAFPGRLTYHVPEANLGYARACNRGLALLQPVELIAVVNPDVALERTLSELAATADLQHGELVAGRLGAGADGAVNARPLVTPAREFAKAIVGSRAYRLPGLAAADGRMHEVGQLDGALLLTDAITWTQLGGFDERFELYYEDVDLCARAGRRGRCLLLNSSWGSHTGGHSFRESGGPAFVALRVSRVRYARKWWRPAPFALFAVGAITALEYVSRTLTSRAEGRRTRLLALHAAFAELRRPGSQQILSPALAAEEADENTTKLGVRPPQTEDDPWR